MRFLKINFLILVICFIHIDAKTTETSNDYCIRCADTNLNTLSGLPYSQPIHRLVSTTSTPIEIATSIGNDGNVFIRDSDTPFNNGPRDWCDTNIYKAKSSLVSWDFKKMIEITKERFGSNAVQNIANFQIFLESCLSLSESEKIASVNKYINENIIFTEDSVLWNKKDYWATPVETMGKMAGDCEDYSIIKYMALRSLGIPKEKLRMTYVKLQVGGPNSNIRNAHMVLHYYPNPEKEPLILDNLVSNIYPDSRRKDLTTVFSFNTEGIFVPNRETKNLTVEHFSLWSNAMKRMRAEGHEF